MAERTSEDPTIEYFDELDKRVTAMEEKAEEAASDRWVTTGTAGMKLFLGGSLFYNIVTTHNINSDTVIPYLIAMGIGAWSTYYGLMDAGKAPEKFRKASSLMNDSRMLRSSLSATMANAILDLPSRKLDAELSKKILEAPKYNPNSEE